MATSIKEATLADMAVIHDNYDKLMAQGPIFIKAVADAIKNAKSSRKGTKLMDADEYEVRFTCFSIPLLLRVEFDIPSTERTHDDDVQGDLVLYQCIEDDDKDLELKRFDFIKDLDGNQVNLFKYNARGFLIGYEADDTPRGKGHLKDPKTAHYAYFKEAREFPSYFLDNLERHIAASRLRVIPK